jgi:hypothetical protein
MWHRIFNYTAMAVKDPNKQSFKKAATKKNVPVKEVKPLRDATVRANINDSDRPPDVVPERLRQYIKAPLYEFF